MRFAGLPHLFSFFAQATSTFGGVHGLSLTFTPRSTSSCFYILASRLLCFSFFLKNLLAPKHHTHNVLISILFIMIALPSSQFFTCIIVYRSFVFIINHPTVFLVNLGFYSKSGKLCTKYAMGTEAYMHHDSC